MPCVRRVFMMGTMIGRFLPGLGQRWLLAVFLAGAWWTCAEATPTGVGEPFLQYFSPKDYQGNTQCLCATQDRRGVMYIGSLGMALEYDGSTWRKINIESNIVASIAYDAATDTVFVGAENNLGYLQSLPSGERAFVSLLTRLPPDQRAVGTIYGVHVTPDGVFFVGTKQLMRWRGGVFKTWELATASRLKSDWAGGRLYVSSPEVGLLRLENDALVPASDDPLFHRVSVRTVLTEPDGSLLIATFHDGLFTLRDGLVTPRDSECTAFLKEKGVAKMLRLRDGSMAVATDSAGLLILDRSLRFRSHADNAGGLRGTNIFNLFEDAEGGVWLSLQSGITRAEVNSPLSVLRAGPNDDMSETYNAGYWFGTMVLASATGLYRVVPAAASTATSAHLEQFPQIRNTITSVCTVENGLLMLSRGKITLLDAQARVCPVADDIVGIKDLCASRVHPGRVYVIDESGRISALRLEAKTRLWVRDSVVADLGAAGGEYGLAESAQGDLWVSTKEHGLYRVALSPGAPAAVTAFFDQPGPLHGDPIVLASDGAGPLRFRGSHLFCGLDDSGQTVRPLTEFGPSFRADYLNPSSVVSCDAQTVWITATFASDPQGYGLRGRAVAGGPDHPPAFRSLPRKIESLIGGPGMLFPVEVPPEGLETLLLIGTGPEVVRLDVSLWDAQPEPPPFATRILRAFTTNKADSPAEPPILAAPLPYARNSPHFEFAAGTLAFGASPRFQTRLVNFGASEWSDFSDRPNVDYLNLPEGRYTFEVRARDADGQLGSTASLGFRILPPWQRSPWAYAAYLLALMLGVSAFIRWRGRLLSRRNLSLEALVSARTSQLRGRETDLLRARDDAERANRAKSAFLANMSHELRTPLNAILGYSQILLKHADLSARSREQVSVIGQSGGQLLALINEVLDLSKIEAGKLTLNHGEFFLPQLLDEVSAAFRPRFVEKGLTFTEVRAPNLPAAVYSDASRLRQVLFNLLSNAVKFTQRGGVRLAIELTEERHVRFEVTDTGTGITKEDLHDIFLAFHQGSDSSLAAQGTGLGLAISQRLVGLLGGRIEVQSTPGEGSRFWFDLPMLPAATATASTLHGVSSQTPGTVIGYEGAVRRLLLVDDQAENRRVLRDFLQPLGFEIEEAATGDGCLESCARHLPDALLLDLRLGVPDGFEVARRLRQRVGATPLGIIAVSASVFESDRQRAIDAGCDDFLPKPFEETQLLASLGRVLGLRWVQARQTVPTSILGSDAADGQAAPLLEEIDALLELSRRGDIVGLRKRLNALRQPSVTDGTAALVRRLEPMVAAYQMEEIHALLLEVQTHTRS